MPTTHGFSRTPTYRTWASMVDRCRSPGNYSYRWYGARGISVCEQWQTFDGFLADMGIRPDGMTLDRIDPNGNYEPANCRWAEWAEQQKNRRHVRLSPEAARRVRGGEFGAMTNKEIAGILGCHPSAVSRIKSGAIWVNA